MRNGAAGRWRTGGTLQAGRTGLSLFSSTVNAVADLFKPVTVTQLLELYDIKKELSEDYLNSHFVTTYKGVFSYKQLQEHNNKKRYAQYLKLIETMNRFAAEKSLAMAFITATLGDNRFNDENIKIVKYQSEILRKFTRSIRDDKLFREPTEGRKKRIRMKDGWYYISPERFQYIYTLEFQKDYTLHSHYVCYIPDEPDAFINLFEVVRRKHDGNDSIGRVEFVAPIKYREYFMRRYSLKRFDQKSPDCYVEAGTNTRKGDFIYLKFINDDSAYQKNYYLQIMRYISKYIMKGIGQSGDGSGKNRDRVSDALIKYNNLRMISYSRTLAPFYMFNEFYKELKAQGIGLYELTKLRKAGKVSYEVSTYDQEYTQQVSHQFESLAEYARYIDYLEQEGLVDDQARMNHYNMYIRCFEEGDFRPNLSFTEIYSIENQRRHVLTINELKFIHSMELSKIYEVLLVTHEHNKMSKCDISTNKQLLSFNIF